jgi:glycerol-1-phosphate dehydrogenase [NAD(P)+]
MIPRPSIYIGPGAVDRLQAYLAEHNLRRLALVADANTYAALGDRVEAALRGAGLDVLTILLAGPEIIVDESQVIDVMLRNDARERAFLAVGSGTVTDIVRFVTLQTGGAFISLPTAPSVDGYTSPITPMVVKRLKITAPGHLPQAIFADLDTLRAAPRPMIAAGVGDVIAKWTSTADWKLGRLLWGDHYDAAIAGRFVGALQRVVDAADAIAVASEDGIRALMEGLIESGLCMADFGTSFPASGSEHLLSHFWESRLLAERRPALLHGAKVGVGTVLAAGYWQQVRGLSRAEAARRLSASRLPSREQEIAHIRTGWPFAVAQVLEAQARFLAMTEADYDTLKTAVLDRWDEIQAIAAEVPPPDAVARLLRKVGGPMTAQEAGLEERDLADGLAYAFYLRDRLPVLRLRRMLDLN